MMKKTIAFLRIVLMLFALAACTNQTAQAPQATQAPIERTVETVNVPSETDAPTETETPETQSNEASGSKTLIAFFSPANSDTVDAVSGATPRVGNVSSTEYVANLIYAKIGGDIAKIVPETAYPLPYNDAADQAKAENDNDARPAFTLDVNPEDYDVIFVGYPMWWYEMPMIMDTFFDTYDFSGKTIIPFNTHAGSRDGGTYRDIAGLEPNATVLDGLAVSGERAGNAEGDVNDWLNKLGF